MPRIALKNLPDQAAALLAHRPEILKAWIDLDVALMGRGSTLPTALKENVRVALSDSVGCRYCASLGEYNGVKPDVGESLARAFARQIVDDYKSIDVTNFDALREEFTDEQIVELAAWICFKLAANILGTITALEPATEDQRAGYQAWLKEQVSASHR
ncbi:MAG: carboxymuconolactone decarboxylase family protein [Pseudonocardiaceae bacterium]